MKQLQKRLEQKNIKPTYIRLKILNYLDHNKNHPTVEQIHKAVKKEVPTVSMTSIYNSLEIFCQKNLIKPLYFTGTETRFDVIVSPHYHFFCERCGVIIDLQVEKEYFKKRNVEGHRVIEIQGCFKGICKNCLKNNKEERRKK